MPLAHLRSEVVYHWYQHLSLFSQILSVSRYTHIRSVGGRKVNPSTSLVAWSLQIAVDQYWLGPCPHHSNRPVYRHINWQSASLDLHLSPRLLKHQLVVAISMVTWAWAWAFARKCCQPFPTSAAPVYPLAHLSLLHQALMLNLLGRSPLKCFVMIHEYWQWKVLISMRSSVFLNL